jgi:hypothetical protein
LRVFCWVAPGLLRRSLSLSRLPTVRSGRGARGGRAAAAGADWVP